VELFAEPVSTFSEAIPFNQFAGNDMGSLVAPDRDVCPA
jgi:hypothetical protein